jgi:hypothetical protein
MIIILLLKIPLLDAFAHFLGLLNAADWIADCGNAEGAGNSRMPLTFLSMAWSRSPGWFMASSPLDLLGTLGTLPVVPIYLFFFPFFYKIGFPRESWLKQPLQPLRSQHFFFVSTDYLMV